MSLQGKSVVVTGGAKGIGRYIALGCARRGANVTVADVDRDALGGVQTELNEAGAAAQTVEADVRDETQVQHLMDTVATLMGGIDYLVNNAGVVPHFSWGGPRWPSVRDLDFSFWQQVVATNLHGSFLCTKHVIPHLERRGGGHIVNLHGGGRLSPPGACAYVVTKEALVTFTRYVAEEVRDRNICVMCISPGSAIATEWAPAEVRVRMPGPEYAGDRFFLAADADMRLSGHLIEERDGALVVVNEREWE